MVCLYVENAFVFLKTLIRFTDLYRRTLQRVFFFCFFEKFIGVEI